MDRGSHLKGLPINFRVVFHHLVLTHEDSFEIGAHCFRIELTADPCFVQRIGGDLQLPRIGY